MKVRVWLKGHEDKAREVKLRGLLTDPIFPMNVRDYLCRSGFYSWKDYARIRFKKLKEAVKFIKNTRGFYYIILDMNRYERFWIGRRPSTRDLFEEWLKDPDVTMRTVSAKHGKRSISLLSGISQKLKKQGILKIERIVKYTKKEEEKIKEKLRRVGHIE